MTVPLKGRFLEKENQIFPQKHYNNPWGYFPPQKEFYNICNKAKEAIHKWPEFY